MTSIRQMLAEIPGLAAQLPQFLLGTKPAEEGGSIHTPARSKPPVDLALLDLIDGREIYNWTRLAYETMTDLHYDQPGPANWDSIKDCCAWLAKHCEWITEQFPEPEPVAYDPHQCSLRCPDGHYLTRHRVHTKGGKMTCQMCHPGFVADLEALYWCYRRAARELPPAKLACLNCGNSAFIDGQWLICTEVEDHARTVTDIEHEYRYRQPSPAGDLAVEFATTVDQLRDWKRRGKLHAAGTQGRSNMYWPWDVFCLVNPIVAEAIDRRDTTREVTSA